MTHEKVQTFGGFSEDVKTPQDAIEVLSKTFGTDVSAWEQIIRSGKLSSEVKDLAEVKVQALKLRSGSV